MADGFDRMDLREAQAQCSKVQDIVFDICGACGLRVGLHCSDCKIQVTGCFCSEIDRFGTDEAMRRMVAKMGEERAHQAARQLGIWTPGMHR